MSETTSTNPMLYFLVGGILVAVLAIGYFTLGRDSSEGSSVLPSVAAEGSDDATGSSLKLNVEKDGSVSGSIDRKSGD